MTEGREAGGEPSRVKAQPSIRKLDFGKDRSFQDELQRRVDQYFLSTGRRKRDCWQMYVKTAIILTCFVASYVLLVFAAHSVWQGLLLVATLALCTAGIGFDIQHDGGHKAYSDRAWVNNLTAWMLDMIGGSSGRWRWKHAVIHHRFTNITGYDSDIEVGPLARLTPHQRRFPYHRWQHLYLWPFYGLLAIKMQFPDDLRYVITGRLGQNRVPRPVGWELVLFVAGKAAFFSWAFAIPMMFHPVWTVLFFYVVGAIVLGTVMVLVFIVPHMVEMADFPLPREDGAMEQPWAVHQVHVTVNFGRGSRVLTWLIGGLNYHKEHHLFPVISHVNYPGMSGVVEETCRDFNVPYHAHSSFLAGIAAHYRWLKRMGRDESK